MSRYRIEVTLRGSSWPMRPFTAVAVAAVACSALSGCGGFLVESGSQSSRAAGGGESSTGAATPTGEPIGQLDSLGDTSEKAEFATYYDQELDWQRCGKFECATVQVPMDWTRPEDASIALELVRRPATEPDERIGSLVFNPGGPGNSGVEIVKERGDSLISSDVAKRYDLVGFDPRGVGSSEPIDCVADKELDEWLAADYQPDTPEGFQQGSELAADFAKGCEQHTGALLPYVDTWSAARDMDVIRQALGDDQLHYLGASYGTLLGATYAGFYPQRVGRLVLDGGLDPANNGDDLLVGQAEGFENAMRQFVQACLDGKIGACPLSGSVDEAMRQVDQMIEKAETQPIKTDTERDVTASMLGTGIVAGLYNDQDWPFLAEALGRAQQGDGNPILLLDDFYSQRTDSGAYRSNIMEAFPAVNCLDYPALQSEQEMQEQAKRLQEVAPVFGPRMAYSDLLCSQWPHPPVRKPGEITADGARPRTSGRRHWPTSCLPGCC